MQQKTHHMYIKTQNDSKTEQKMHLLHK